MDRQSAPATADRTVAGLGGWQAYHSRDPRASVDLALSRDKPDDFAGSTSIVEDFSARWHPIRGPLQSPMGYRVRLAGTRYSWSSKPLAKSAKPGSHALPIAVLLSCSVLERYLLMRSEASELARRGQCPQDLFCRV